MLNCDGNAFALQRGWVGEIGLRQNLLVKIAFVDVSVVLEGRQRDVTVEVALVNRCCRANQLVQVSYVYRTDPAGMLGGVLFK